MQEARTNVFLGRFRATLQSGKFEKQDEIIERLLEEGFTSTDIASALIHHLQNEGAPPPQEEPQPDRAQRRVGREDQRQRVDRSRVEIRERPVLSKEGEWPLARAQRRTEEPASQPQSPTEAPTAKTRPKQGGAVTNQAGRTQMQSARENVRIPVAPARRDSRHPPVRFEESSRRALKKSCATPKDKTRLYMNVGEEMNIGPEDVVKAILGETGLPRQVVGKVDVRERHLFADVVSEHAHAIIGRLNRSDIKGRRIKVKLA